MSGSYVQRGIPAITDKYTRTKMALSAGADIVLELPTIYATASAEFFAYGAIQILDSLNCVNSICFGSECGNVSMLNDIAHILQDEPMEYKHSLTQYLRMGYTFPDARQHAISQMFSDDLQYTDLLKSPNNILGIEYLKSLKRLKSTINPVTIKRQGAGYHEETLNQHISSASAIRAAIANHSNEDMKQQIPIVSYPYWESAFGKSLPVSIDDFSNLLYYKLLKTSTHELESYLDSNPDISKRIQNLLPEFTNISEFTQLLNTKNMTYARLSRILLHILLDIYKEDIKQTVAPYARILGFQKEASHLLRHAREQGQCSLITKVADAPNILTEAQMNRFQLDIHSTHLYNHIVYSKFHHRIKDEYRQNIIIQK